MKRYSPLFLFILPLFFPSMSLAETQFSVGYDSHYVSEGRDNLSDGGISWLNLTHSLGDKWSVIADYGIALHPDAEYDELNLALQYSDSYQDLNYYFSVMRLEFFQDGAHDNELYFGLSWSGSRWAEPYVDFVFSTENEGGFLQAGLQKYWQLSERFNLTAYAASGWDYGYITEQFDGHNHYAVGTIVDFSLSETSILSLKAEYNISGTDIERQLGRSTNVSWAGLHYSTTF